MNHQTSKVVLRIGTGTTWRGRSCQSESPAGDGLGGARHDLEFIEAVLFLVIGTDVPQPPHEEMGYDGEMVQNSCPRQADRPRTLLGHMDVTIDTISTTLI